MTTRLIVLALFSALLLGGLTAHVPPHELIYCNKLNNVDDTDDNFLFFSVPYAASVTTVWCTCEGTCSTLAEVAFLDGSANAMTHATLTCGTEGGTSTPQLVTAAGNLAAGEAVQFSVTNDPQLDTDEAVFCLSFVRR